MVWVPRGVDPATREVLVDGVPTWLKPALMAWLKPFLAYEGVATGAWFFRIDELRAFDVVGRPQPTYTSRAEQSATWPGFVDKLSGDELLDLADWIVHRTGYADRVTRLDALLADASSAWKVGRRNGLSGLVRRVPESVETAARASMTTGLAGALLTEAWAACYGRDASPEEAYEKAIKAVEEAAAHVVSPSNSKATLGSMIRDMRSQKDWTVDLPGSDRDVVVDMMSALWTGQESRHGGNGYRVPTHAEAETAVLIAVPLVQWFSTGSIARRP